MKAYQIMMFFLLFNLVISLLAFVPIEDNDGNTRHGIFRIPTTVPTEYNATDIETSMGGTESEFNVWRFLGGITVAGFAAMFISGAITGWIIKIPSDSAAAYSVFSGTFWGITYGGISILLGLAEVAGGGSPTVIIRVFVGIFIGITAVVFIVGLLQLVKGGWAAYR